MILKRFSNIPGFVWFGVVVIVGLLAVLYIQAQAEVLLYEKELQKSVIESNAYLPNKK